ncbi:MAG TPA: hypothetical protein VG033_00965 [Candidatus Acidoferrales bacterium]|jgi:uncharacterized delta-60 repeat protein|nr:hypothetical protein [Candidatus Acidoferrales bacterium]
MSAFTPSHRASLLILCLLLIAPASALAQAGQLDPSFGTGGIVTTDFGVQSNSNIAVANAATIQPDGKILVCGGIPSSNGFPSAAVARYNTDGSLDSTFGTAGIVTTRNVPVPTAITLQTDGKIVVTGAGADNINVVRYTSNGTLDSTFGNGGIFTSGLILVGFGSTSGVLVQPNGDILVAEGVLLRLLPDGQVDSSFGTDGQAKVADNAPTALALLPNGKILVASAVSGFVTRYNSNGSLDTTFAINGQLPTAGPADALVLLGTGEFLVGANLTSAIAGPVIGFAVSRYLGVGAVDTKFAAHGGVVTPVPDFPRIATTGLGVQPAGDIVTLGTASTFTQQVFALARYTAAGKLDSTFGTAGVVTTSFGSSSVNANSLAIQSDGKIVAVGSFLTQMDHGVFDTGFKLVRYLGQ